jgi:hypothetical protein
MNSFYSEYEVAQRQQTFQHEAEIENLMQQLHRETHDKFDGKHFWYEVLALPIPFYDAQHANIAQPLAYDTFRRRTQSLVLMVSSVAFGLGMLIGGWLNLGVVLIPGCIALLVACVLVARRLIVLVKRQMAKPVLR